MGTGVANSRSVGRREVGKDDDAAIRSVGGLVRDPDGRTNSSCRLSRSR